MEGKFPLFLMFCPLKESFAFHVAASESVSDDMNIFICTRGPEHQRRNQVKVQQQVETVLVMGSELQLKELELV